MSVGVPVCTCMCVQYDCGFKGLCSSMHYSSTLYQRLYV